MLDYGSTAKAAAFVGGMAKIARACYAPSKKVGADDPLTVVVEPVRLGARTVLDRRREYGVGATAWLWSEMVVQHGSRVGLLILATAPVGRPARPRPALRASCAPPSAAEPAVRFAAGVRS